MVVARTAPKSSSVARIPIKPLCLHHRLTERPEQVEATIQGAWTALVEGRKAEAAARAAAAASGTAGGVLGGGPADEAPLDDLESVARAIGAKKDAGAAGSASQDGGAGGSGGGDTSAAAQAAALGAIAKASADPKVSAAALALAILPPSQTCPVRDLPAAYPWTRLTVSGAFSLSQIHDWVGACLPDVPARLIADGKTETVALAFRNVFVGSHLTVRYSKGSASFSSDNPSTIAILKDALSGAAGAVKVRLATDFEVHPFAMRAFASLVHSRLVYALMLGLKAELYEAVKEMVAGDGGGEGGGGGAGGGGSEAQLLLQRPYLHPEFADILARGERYAAEARSGKGKQGAEALGGVLTDAFVDAHRLRGTDVTPKIAQLQALLPRYHLSIEAAGGRMVRGSDVVASFLERAQ
jgi:hypothetical protein